MSVEGTKNQEKKDTAPAQNQVEKASVQEKKKLDISRQALKSSRTADKNSSLQKKDKKEANKMLDDIDLGFDFGPGKNKEKTSNTPENFVESLEVKEAKNALKKHEDAYREQVRSTYEAEMQELKEAPRDQKDKKNAEYLQTYAKDLQLDPKNVTKEDLQKLAETLPDAYKTSLLNAEIDLGPEGNALREKVLSQLFSSELQIFKQGKGEEKELLRKNFHEITGLPESAYEDFLKNSIPPDSFPEVEKQAKPYKSTETGSYERPTRNSWSGAEASIPESPATAGPHSVDNHTPEELQNVVNGMTQAQREYAWKGADYKLSKALGPKSNASPQLLAALARQGTNPGGSLSRCYRAVKNHLCAAGYIDSSYEMSRASAKDAGPELTNIGFTNIGVTKQTQAGDVCVFSGGEHGHIEINTGDGFASDFWSPQMCNGRTLIGVYRPPQKTGEIAKKTV